MNFMLTIVFNIGLFLLLGCDKAEQKNPPSELDGNWSLIRFQAGFSPIENYKINEIVWSIKSSKLDITINVDLEINSRIPFKEAASYELTIDEKIIIIDGQAFDYSLRDSLLILDQEASSDGPLIKFERMP